MRRHFGLLGGAAISLICLVPKATASPVRWQFTRYAAENAKMVDVTSDVDRKCTATYTRTVYPFTLGIRYPPTCAVTAKKIADALETGLRALTVRWPWLFSREIYIDIPVALDPLPPTCRYVGRTRSKNTIGVLALLRECSDAELQPALLDIIFTALHESAHAVGAARSFPEAGAEWAVEGVAEYVALKGMETVDPGFVAKQLEQREPVTKFMNCESQEFERAFRLKQSHSDKLQPTDVIRVYDLYLGAFLVAEAAGYQLLGKPEGPGKRSAIRGVDLETLISKRSTQKRP